MNLKALQKAKVFNFEPFEERQTKHLFSFSLLESENRGKKKQKFRFLFLLFFYLLFHLDFTTTDLNSSLETRYWLPFEAAACIIKWKLSSQVIFGYENNTKHKADKLREGNIAAKNNNSRQTGRIKYDTLSVGH